jgi:hypothetical protein
MKVIFTNLIFFFSYVLTFAQTTEKVVKYFSSKQISEQYNVLKSDKTTRNGEYITYFAVPFLVLKEVKNDTSKLNDYIKIKGFYENGKKQGVWTEYAAKYIKKSKGNYELGKKIGIWETYQENGFVVECFDYDKNEKLEPLFFLPHIPYPQKSRFSGVEGKVTLSYAVNSDCTISNIKIIKSLNEECDNAVLQIFNKSIALFYPKYNFNCQPKTQSLDVNFTLGYNPNDY